MSEVCLVTGASSGIGKDISEKLISNGYVVYAVARRVERLKELESLGAKVLFFDLRDESSIKSVVDRIISEAGKIDVLINNAGVGLLAPVKETPIEKVREEFEVNFFGPLKLTQMVLPYMIKRKRGKIINISSVSAKVSILMYGWYSASKAAMEMVSDALRMEVKPFGIDVIVVEPGSIKSEWYKNATRYLDEITKGTYYEGVANHIIKNMVKRQEGKLPSPEVVSKAILNIVKARNPKPRYILTSEAKLILFLKWILPEQIFYWILNNHFKNKW